MLQRAAGSITENWAMRMMLKIKMPTQTANRAIPEGSFAKVMEATMSRLKPEAAYFHADNGCRAATMFFDLRDNSDIPTFTEPLFSTLDATIELIPVMNADELKKGLNAAAQAR
jgi:hypothetical protein